MLRVLTWTSPDKSPRLTAAEIDSLVAFTLELSKVGELSNGKFVVASQPLFWHRHSGGN